MQSATSISGRRRLLLQASLALPALAWLPRLMAQPAPTPPCGAADEPTPTQTAGPFYTPDSPEKADFRPDDPDGEPVVLKAQVLDTQCRPLPGAIVDLWHADTRGRYDNEGYRLRGHQRAGADGSVRFTTVLPGRYPFRTRHYHVRIVRDGRRVLTTQLYFPAEGRNARDGLFQPELLMDVARSGAAREARFTFYVDNAS